MEVITIFPTLLNKSINKHSIEPNKTAQTITNSVDISNTLMPIIILKISSKNKKLLNKYANKKFLFIIPIISQLKTSFLASFSPFQHCDKFLEHLQLLLDYQAIFATFLCHVDLQVCNILEEAF